MSYLKELNTIRLLYTGIILQPKCEGGSECLIQILFYIGNNTYIMSSYPKEFFPSFKTLELVADQSSAANSTYASNFQKSKIYKGKSAADFFGGPPKIYRGI